MLQQVRASCLFANNTKRVLLVGYLPIIIAEQNYQQALINLSQSQASRLADTVALFQALGGGWWNRNLPPKPQQHAVLEK